MSLIFLFIINLGFPILSLITDISLKLKLSLNPVPIDLEKASFAAYRFE